MSLLLKRRGRVKFVPMERDVLIVDMLANGKRVGDIARECEMSVRTLEGIVNRLKAGCGARTIAHLVTRFVELGYLSIETKADGKV